MDFKKPFLNFIFACKIAMYYQYFCFHNHIHICLPKVLCNIFTVYYLSIIVNGKINNNLDTYWQYETSMSIFFKICRFKTYCYIFNVTSFQHSLLFNPSKILKYILYQNHILFQIEIKICHVIGYDIHLYYNQLLYSLFSK